MANLMKKPERDVEKAYSTQQFVAKLRRLADCIEQERRFRIQIAGERISVPPDAVINIEHGPLCPFEQDLLVGLDALLKQLHGILNVRPKLLAHGAVIIHCFRDRRHLSPMGLHDGLEELNGLLYQRL